MEDMKAVLEKSRELFYNQGESLYQDLSMNQFQLVTLAGTIPTKDVERFHKIIFRITRTNSLVYTFNIHNFS